MNITELQLLTDHPGQTKKFYHEILGLEILSSDGAVTSFVAGISVLTFHKSDGNKPVYHFAFNIASDQFEVTMARVAAKVKLIETSPSGCVADFRSWNAKAFYFYDNNNNIVEMIARFDLEIDLDDVNCPVYSISEIGLVVENPTAYANELLNKYDLQFFSKQAPLEDFIAVGNDDGLFIIVTENRKWYPTTIRSSKHWAKIMIALPEGMKEIII